MTREQVKRVLIRKVSSEGNAEYYAAVHGLSFSSLREILAGRRAPSEAVLDHLGLVRVVTYKAKVSA